MNARELRQVFSLANAFKEGDLLVDGTTDDRVREDARRALLATTVGDIRRTVLVDDGVTVALARSRDRQFDADLDALTIGQVKAPLLGPGAAAWARRHQDALASEVVAAVAKVMANDELSTVARLYTVYAKGGGDERAASSLEEEGRRRLNELRERGFDLGSVTPSEADARLERIYRHARRALYATVDDAVIKDVSPRSLRVRTMATSRDDYLVHPPTGEQLSGDDARAVAALPRVPEPQVQLVVSDGLNADAVNEQLRSLLPPVRRFLSDAGYRVAETDVVVQNGRVRAGYEIGRLVGAAVIVHVVGERPGTGINAVSAYLTYGRDEAGQPRWSRDLDHSATTAICGIHPKGKPPLAAAVEIARSVARILEQRRSGVALTASVERA